MTETIVPNPVQEPALDFIIRVDRSIKPNYPEWVERVMHPELECIGPAEYNLQTEVEQWFHNKQEIGFVTGTLIYDHLKKDNILTDCLSLADLLALQTKGTTLFRRLYPGKAVFGWKSVAQEYTNALCVPYLYVCVGIAMLSWRWLVSPWAHLDPALRFRKST